MAVSLDGSVAGPNGDDSGLHVRFFPPSGSVSAGDARVIEESADATGAIPVGRRAYDLGDRVDGFVDTTCGVERFVLARAAPKRVAPGETAFAFVTSDSALEQAGAAAGDRRRHSVSATAGRSARPAGASKDGRTKGGRKWTGR